MLSLFEYGFTVDNNFVRSIETTSPVSSSTKSSIHVFQDTCSQFTAITFFRFVLFTFTSSARIENLKISLSFSKPIARNNVVTGNFFLRSIDAYITLLMSVTNSIHEPYKQINTSRIKFRTHWHIHSDRKTHRGERWLARHKLHAISAPLAASEMALSSHNIRNRAERIRLNHCIKILGRVRTVSKFRF